MIGNAAVVTAAASVASVVSAAQQFAKDCEHQLAVAIKSSEYRAKAVQCEQNKLEDTTV